MDHSNGPDGDAFAELIRAVTQSETGCALLEREVCCAALATLSDDASARAEIIEGIAASPDRGRAMAAARLDELEGGEALRDEQAVLCLTHIVEVAGRLWGAAVTLGVDPERLDPEHVALVAAARLDWSREP